MAKVAIPVERGGEARAGTAVAPTIPDPKRIKSFRTGATLDTWLRRNHARETEPRREFVTAVARPNILSVRPWDVDRALGVNSGQRPETGADCSTAFLMEASAVSSPDRVLSTTIFRSIEPVNPVNPSCSDPLRVSR